MLLEALLAVMVLSIGLLAVIQAVQKSVKVTHFRRYYLAPARQLADAVLADLALQSTSGKLGDGVVMRGERGTFRYEVMSWEWPVVPGLREVRVIVSWSDQGKPASLSLATLLPASGRRGTSITRTGQGTVPTYSDSAVGTGVEPAANLSDDEEETDNDGWR